MGRNVTERNLGVDAHVRDADAGGPSRAPGHATPVATQTIELRDRVAQIRALCDDHAMFGFGKPTAPAKATILKDEGCGLAIKGAGSTLWHQTYIVEVHPENPGDPPFRTEVKVWVSKWNSPEEGAVVRALYKPGTKHVEIVLAGDPRFDWNLREANQAAKDAAEREALLNAPPGTSPAAPSPQHAPPGADAMAFGTHVLVQWTDGHHYPGLCVQVANGQMCVAFPDGRQLWVPASAVSRG